MAAAPKKLTIPLDFKVDFADLDKALDGLRDIGERMTIWSDVSAEIDRARRKHGVQHDIPMGTGPAESFLWALDQAAAEAGLYGDEGDDRITLDTLDNADAEVAAKHLCQETGDSWVKILGEEFLEAAATDDPADLDAELVQTIAMGVSMLQALRRQQAEVAAS